MAWGLLWPSVTYLWLRLFILMPSKLCSVIIWEITLGKQKWIGCDHPSGFRKAVSARRENRWGFWLGQIGVIHFSLDSWASLGISDACWSRRAAKSPCHLPVHALGWLFSLNQIHIFWIFLVGHKIHFKAAHGPCVCSSLAWGQTVTPTTPRMLRIVENFLILHSNWSVPGCLHGWVYTYSWLLGLHWFLVLCKPFHFVLP